MDVSYKSFTTILNNIINMSSNNIQDYALKVAHVADVIFEQKGYSKKQCLDLFLINMIKHLTHPTKLLLEEALNDIINTESTKHYAVTKGVMDYCVEFNNLSYWKTVVKNQNITYATYKEAGSPVEFPKEIFTMRFAEKVVLAFENLKNIDEVLNDFENNQKEDIEALQKADYKYNLYNSLKTDEYKTNIFNKMDEFVPDEIKFGIIKLIFIMLDFKSPLTIYHSALMYQICKFISEKSNLNEAESYILNMCSYIANIGAFSSDLHCCLMEEPTKEEAISIINHKIIGINEAFRNVSILNYQQTLCKQFEYNDGSGYPLGLCASDLNMYSKILTIANRFAELYQDTQYSKGTKIDEIYSILKYESNQGKLEEQYVDIILNNKKEFFTNISNIIFNRKQLYNDLFKPKNNNEIADYSVLKVLVVEDSDLDWMVFSKILSGFKIEAQRATSGQVALQMVNDSKRFDLIFMDIQMPDMNGHETTKAIRSLKDKKKAGTPIYAVTADTFSGGITTCLNSGMNGHFSKPIDVNRLIKVCEHIFLNKTGNQR